MTVPSISKGVPISDKLSTDKAFGTILRHNFDYMLGWAPIAYKRDDIEGVHQVRVAFRRMRSALVIFRRAIPRAITDPWSEEMRWIANEFGLARDMDVFVDEGLNAMAGKIPLACGEKKLGKLAIQQRNNGYARVRTMMDGPRYKKFVDGFDLWLKERGWFQANMMAEVRKDLGKEISGYAAKVMDKRMTKILQAGERMGEMSEEELHQLRIECKKLRYAIEFFTSLFDKKGMTAFTLHLKGLQGLLGTMNDVAVMPGLLEGILKGVNDAETLQYAGALIGWRARQYEEVRGQLDGRWTEFANTPIPWKN